MAANPTNPCGIRHRSTAAARACPGYHPGIDPETGAQAVWEAPATRPARPAPLDIVEDRSPEQMAADGDEQAPLASAAENPTNPPQPASEAGAKATTRPGRDAIWKSVIGATGGWGCERETFYREVVRDARGYRLRFGADEPIVFGVAIDSLHGWLMQRRLDAGPEDTSTVGYDLSEEGEGLPFTEDMLRENVVTAVRHAVGKARARERSEPWTEDDWRVLANSVGLAGEKLVGLWPNRMKERTKGGEVVEWLPQPEPEGTPAGPPIAWLDQPGVTIQLQRKMFSPDVVGGRGISGQPDYVFVRDGLIVGWLDVKALSRAGSFPAKWAAGEAVAYDYMCSTENGGVLPEWHGYLEYRRVAKPYWALITAPVNPAVIRLARAYFDRWGRALDGNDPDALSFSPKSCGRCQYREPIHEGAVLLHPGCPIGGPALDIAPVAEEE